MAERFELSVFVGRENQKDNYEQLFREHDFRRYRLEPNTVNDFCISAEFR